MAELEAEQAALEAQIAASDEAERQRAGEWRAAAEAAVAADFDLGMGAEKKAWFDACCGDREGDVTVLVPEDSANPACARLLDRLLRRWVGPPYCYMSEVAVTLHCRRPWTASGADFTYFPTAERQRGCCWQGRAEPPEPPRPPAEPEPVPPSRGGEPTEPGRDRPPPRRPPGTPCDCRLAVPVAAGAVLPVALGGLGSFAVQGSCGAGCAVAGTTWPVQPPPLGVGGVPVPQPPVRIAGPALRYGFADPGSTASGSTRPARTAAPAASTSRSGCRRAAAEEGPPPRPPASPIARAPAVPPRV